jgi:hypothetical protein
VMAATAMTAIGVGADVAGGVVAGVGHGQFPRPVRLTGPLLTVRGLGRVPR